MEDFIVGLGILFIVICEIVGLYVAYASSFALFFASFIFPPLSIVLGFGHIVSSIL